MSILFTLLLAAAPTVVHDQQAANRIRGNDGITLQWIDWWKHRGTLDVRDREGRIELHGSQREAKGRGSLTLDGVVTDIAAREFRFRGRIVITDAPDTGRHCVRDGDFTFKITGQRRYWRLQQMEACDGLTDYVDIFF